MPSDVLPAAVDAQSPLTASELAVLRQQYLDETAKGWVSVQTKFNYAWGSVKSDSRTEVGEGVALLMDIYRTEPSRRRECLYFLAVGHYKLGNYPESKRYNGLLLEKEPNNIQAQSLDQLVEQAVAKEGYVGMAIAGGAAAAAGILFAALMSSRGRR
ncbi:Fis1p [Rhodotorula paludigena]|uniref:Fis1p n=1 Tax=Rhodotorula paludigena TaxID=86838 RepID=UPI00317F57F1